MNIVILTKRGGGCPHCDEAIQLLEDRQQQYVKLALDEAGRAAVYEEHMWKTVPMVFINGTFIGGKDELVRFLERKDRTQKPEMTITEKQLIRESESQIEKLTMAIEDAGQVIRIDKNRTPQELARRQADLDMASHSVRECLRFLKAALKP